MNELIDPGEHPEETHAIAPVNDIRSMMAAAVASGKPEMVSALADAYAEAEETRLARKSVEDFNAAKTQATIDMPAIKKDAENKHLRSNYASLDGMLHTVKPVLFRHGLAVDFTSEETGDSITAVCHLRHVGGHSIESRITLPRDGRNNKGMNDLQGVGSAYTYGARYTLARILGLTIGDDFDDDGNAAHVEYCELLSEKEIDDLLSMIDQTESDKKRFLKACGAGTFSEIRKTPAYFEAARILEGKPIVKS